MELTGGGGKDRESKQGAMRRGEATTLLSSPFLGSPGLTPILFYCLILSQGLLYSSYHSLWSARIPGVCHHTLLKNESG